MAHKTPEDLTLDDVLSLLYGMPRIVMSPGEVEDRMGNAFLDEIEPLLEAYRLVPIYRLIHLSEDDRPAMAAQGMRATGLFAEPKPPEVLPNTTKSIVSPITYLHPHEFALDWRRRALARGVRALITGVNVPGETYSSMTATPVVPDSHWAMARHDKDMAGLLGLRQPGVTFHVQSWYSGNPGKAMMHGQFAFHSDSARNAFSPLIVMLRMHKHRAQTANPTEMYLPVWHMYELLHRLTTQGTLQECFERYQRGRATKPNPQAAVGSWTDRMRSRGGSTRQSSSHSLGEIWLNTAVEALFDTMAHRYASDTVTSVYKTDARPVAVLLHSVARVIEATLKNVNQHIEGYAPVISAIHAARPAVMAMISEDARAVLLNRP